MIKNIILSSLLAIAPVMAADATAPAAAPAPAPQAEAPKMSFMDQIRAMKVMNGKQIKQDAKYYVFLFSANWCYPCRMEMPKIVELYNKLSAQPDNNIELILMDCSGPDDARCAQYQSDFHVPFAAVNIKKEAMNLPIYRQVEVRGIPHMLIYDCEGHLICRDHPGAIIKDMPGFIENAVRRANGDR